MQRKNSILKTTHRSGIAMIMAITVIVIISTFIAISLALTTQTSKKTSDLYLYEQAAILSHSAAEYAVLKATIAAPCSYTGSTFSYNNTFDVDIKMKYLATNPSSCRTNAVANGVLYSTLKYPKSNGTIIMDVTVTSKAGVSTEPIRYFRRSIQKL